MSKVEIMHIDILKERCGYFNSDVPEVNNGYNCSHPDCEESEMHEGVEVGKCYAFACPLFPEADHEDLREHNKNLYEEYKNDSEVNDYLVVDTEAL
jgi:hypothetical protein